MLHYLDDLDSKMESMRAHFEREADVESPWTSYNPALGRPLLNRAKFLEKKPAAATSNVPAADLNASAAAASSASAGNGPRPEPTIPVSTQTPTLSGLESFGENTNDTPVTAVAGDEEA